jgi:hypothetical protein
LAEGMTGRLNQAGINGYAFVDGGKCQAIIK